MAVQDSVAWPPGYRAIMLILAVAGAAMAFVAAVLALLWWPWFWAPALGGVVVALGTLAVWRHMGEHPMLAIDDGDLLCRLKAANSRRSAKLTKIVRFPLGEIERVDREVQAWPAAGGERHVYRLTLASGVTRGLVPRPTDAATRQAMAAFFERHLPGRVHETRLG